MANKTTIPIGLAKVAGRNRCKHPLKFSAGQRTGTLQSSWTGLLSDLKKFGESFDQPLGKAAKAK
jgi:hypothetical protein